MATKLIFFLLSLIALCGSARGVEIAERAPPIGASLTAAVPAPLSAAPVVARRGMLYRVTAHGKSSYLYGTVHIGRQDFFPLEPEVAHALTSASNLVIELDIRNGEPIRRALDKYGVYPEGDTIRNHLSLAAFGKLTDALNKAGMSLADVERYKPWMVANLLIGAELTLRGFQRGQAVEYYLLAAAQKQNKKVLQLESADYQLSLFATLDDEQQERYLLENMADLKDGAALRQSLGLIDAWSHADAAKVDAILQEITASHTVASTFMVDTVLGKRNLLMASSIENIMRDNKVAFIGIGLLHLTGPNGLPTLLRQRGYQVEKVY